MQYTLFKPDANATPMDGDDFDSMEGEAVIEIHEDQQVLEENIAQAPPNTDVPPPVEKKKSGRGGYNPKAGRKPKKKGKGRRKGETYWAIYIYVMNENCFRGWSRDLVT